MVAWGSRVSGTTAEAVASFIIGSTCGRITIYRMAGTRLPCGAGRRPCISGRRKAQPPDWLQNAAAAAQRAGCLCGPASAAPSTWTCADYLVAPVFDYVVSTGPKGKTTAEAINRCHPNVVHVDGSRQRPSVLDVHAPRVAASQAPRRGAAAAAAAAAMDSRRCTPAVRDRCVLLKFSWFGVTLQRRGVHLVRRGGAGGRRALRAGGEVAHLACGFQMARPTRQRGRPGS